MKKTRGRPTKHPIDALRTQIWFKSILVTSGFSSAYQVEMHLDGEKVHKRDKDVARPRKWDSYQKGTVIPIDRPGNRNSIELADAHFCGTAKWFRSPIWAVLKREKWEREQYETALRSLGREVEALLFDDESLYKIKAIDDDILSQICSLGTFESFVAIVLLIQYSELIASVQLRARALFFYHPSQKKLRNNPILEPFHEKLIPSCDSVCKHWRFLSPSQRIDTVIFSRAINLFDESGCDKVSIEQNRDEMQQALLGAKVTDEAPTKVGLAEMMAEYPQGLPGLGSWDDILPQGFEKP